MEGRIGLHDEITANRVRRQMADLALMAGQFSLDEWVLEMDEPDEEILRPKSN